MHYHSGTRPEFAPLAPHPRHTILERVARAEARYRQRRALGRLEPHLRRDVGLSDVDVARETGIPFWNAPGWWF